MRTETTLSLYKSRLFGQNERRKWTFRLPKKKRKNKKLRSVRTPWPRAKYFPVQPSHSVNKYILCSTEKDKTWSNDPSQRDLGVKLAIGENLKFAPLPCATSKWPTLLPDLSIRFHTHCSCAFVRSCVFSFLRRAGFTLKSLLFLCEISVRNYPLQKKSAVSTGIAWKCHAVKSQCEETPLRIFWLAGHFVSSLLAEVSHEEAKMRVGRDLYRLPTRFLSRMRWRFLNNQWRFSHLRHNPQDRFARKTLVETRVCCRPSKFARLTRV